MMRKTRLTMDVEKELEKLRKSDARYNDYLDWFRQVPASVLMKSEIIIRNNISSEGWAAYKRWQEIFEKPSKIDKLLQGQLKSEREADIMATATGDDDEAFWEALIRENVEQLNSSNVSPQEVARLTTNLGIFRDKLHECRSRKPKTGTPLEKVLKAAELSNKPAKKSKTTKKQGSKTASKASKAKKTVSKSNRGKRA